jgi:hypothetical protein
MKTYFALVAASLSCSAAAPRFFSCPSQRQGLRSSATTWEPRRNQRNANSRIIFSTQRSDASVNPRPMPRLNSDFPSLPSHAA